jgi:hypothetical protein
MLFLIFLSIIELYITSEYTIATDSIKNLKSRSKLKKGAGFEKAIDSETE